MDNNQPHQTNHHHRCQHTQAYLLLRFPLLLDNRLRDLFPFGQSNYLHQHLSTVICDLDTRRPHRTNHHHRYPHNQNGLELSYPRYLRKRLELSLALNCRHIHHRLNPTIELGRIRSHPLHRTNHLCQHQGIPVYPLYWGHYLLGKCQPYSLVQGYLRNHLSQSHSTVSHHQGMHRHRHQLSKLLKGWSIHLRQNQGIQADQWLNNPLAKDTNLHPCRQYCHHNHPRHYHAIALHL